MPLLDSGASLFAGSVEEFIAMAPTSSLPSQRPALLGREGTLSEIKQWLGEGTRASEATLVVHGFTGVGKSELARALAYDDDLDRDFDVILWAQLGHKPNVTGLLQRWGN